jgi:NAD(P)-dependent dehydrogenase (short-subunit alcohol dehydrogenase family)
MALAMAGRGADLVLHHHTSSEEAERTADEARAAGASVALVAADLSVSSGVAELLDGAREAFGRVDVLINNASVYRPTPLESLTEAQWDEHMTVNLKAPFLCSLEIGRWMLRQGGGKILNLSDWAAERPYPGFLPYCVSKAALVGLTRALAVELAPRVQVNALALGPVLNPEGMSPAEVQSVPIRNPMGRMGSPEDVAAAAVFLVEGSDFITGAVLPVDGGRALAP